jgi:hypothetical protein
MSMSRIQVTSALETYAGDRKLESISKNRFQKNNAQVVKPHKKEEYQ